MGKQSSKMSNGYDQFKGQGRELGSSLSLIKRITVTTWFCQGRFVFLSHTILLKNTWAKKIDGEREWEREKVQLLSQNILFFFFCTRMIVGTCFDSKKRKVTLSTHSMQGTYIGIIIVNPHSNLWRGEGYSQLCLGLEAERVETLAHWPVSSWRQSLALNPWQSDWNYLLWLWK